MISLYGIQKQAKLISGIGIKYSGFPWRRLGFWFLNPGASQFLCWIPRLESLMWGLEPSQQCENFFGIIVLQSVGHPPGGYGIWFYHDCAPPTILLWVLLCLWTWGIFFGWVPTFFCDGSIASCCFGAVAGGDERMSFYSTILNQKSSCSFLYCSFICNIFLSCLILSDLLCLWSLFHML